MYRTHTCGELNISNVGESVTLSGWVQITRAMGGLTFVDLRDRYGITQLAFNNDTDTTLCERANKLGREFVVQAKGTVIERTSKNLNIPTGEIEIKVSELNVISESETPPFSIENSIKDNEELRLKYRYLDIRRPEMKDRLVMRAKFNKAVREYLDAKDFLEIETPNLIKSTPEGARDFLVPSRLMHGSFYALPQSPQILKQLLMVAGMDRHYQIVRCFRDEDFRGDRQPEFTQVDCEMSFIHQEDIFETFGGMIRHVFKKVKNHDLPELPRIKYDEAIKYYGSDKPDLRFDCKIVELNTLLPKSEFGLFNTAIDNGGLVAGLNATGCASLSRKQFDEQLVEFVKSSHRGAGVLGGLVSIRFNEDGTVKSSVDKFFNEEQLREIGKAFNAQKGDLIVIAADKTSKVRKGLGDLRQELAKTHGWIKPDSWSVLWVVDFPLFEKDEESGEITFAHHPFCSPHPDDMKYFDTDPTRVRAQTYDMVMNGNEVLSGSVRIHQRDIQERVFTRLGISPEDREKKFGFMLNAFRYGAPPHGGCAFGVDRVIMLLAGGETIRDVIAFPKTAGGRDLMMDAPTTVDKKQLDDLGITVKETEIKK
jgi:aspartyl-tRNA synthetase